MNDALTGQTVELLQQLIRNRCVNDGSVASGQEARNSDTLRAYLEGSGLDIDVYEPDGAPGRASLVTRIEGTDPAAPTLWPHGPHGRRAGHARALARSARARPGAARARSRACR